MIKPTCIASQAAVQTRPEPSFSPNRAVGERTEAASALPRLYISTNVRVCACAGAGVGASLGVGPRACAVA
eukprot:8282314-Alexandrium_andersonii.AAC.1